MFMSWNCFNWFGVVATVIDYVMLEFTWNYGVVKGLVYVWEYLRNSFDVTDIFESCSC